MNNLLFLFLLCLATTVNSQTELWTKKVSKGTVMSQLEDGKIFLNDQSKISLVNNISGETEWENNFSTSDDPRFLTGLPLMYFDGESYAIIDATTGHVIDKSKERTEILNISYYWDVGRVVLELDRADNIHALNLDLNDLSKSWNTKIGPSQKKLFGFVSQEIENQPTITKDGSLVFIYNNLISIVDANGNNTKRVEFKTKIKPLELNTEKNIIYLLGDKNQLHLIDISTGITNATFEFEFGDLKLNIIGDGSTISVVQKNELRILDGVFGVQIGSHRFEDKINQTYIDEDSGKFFVLTNKMLAEIDHKSGDVKKKVSFGISFNDIYKINDKTIISGRKGACPIDLSTFKLEFKKPANTPPVHAVVDIGDYIGYTNQSGYNYSFSVVNENGKALWKTSFYSAVTPSFDAVGKGLLIISGRKVRFLDIQNGKALWKNNVEVDSSFTYAIDEKNNDLFMYSVKRLYRFNHSDGSLTRSKDKFKFEDFDYKLQTPQMMVLPDAIFLKGSNTVFVASKEGELIHKMTYERIYNGSTPLKNPKALPNDNIKSPEKNQEVLSIYSDDNKLHEEGMLDSLNEKWGYTESIKSNRRTKQNKSSHPYPYVFTTIENDRNGLIFLDPSTGKERFFVVLNEKDPKYIVDEIDGVLFYLSKFTLKAYDLK